MTDKDKIKEILNKSIYHIDGAEYNVKEDELLKDILAWHEEEMKKAEDKWVKKLHKYLFHKYEIHRKLSIEHRNKGKYPTYDEAKMNALDQIKEEFLGIDKESRLEDKGGENE